MFNANKYNKIQYDLLLKDVKLWNQWRIDNPDIDVQLDGADFSGAKLPKANLDEASLKNANFEGADIEGAYFDDAELSNACFVDSKLKKAHFGDANLKGADLNEADMHLAFLNGANLNNTILTGANLSFADISFVKSVGADLNNVNLEGAILKFSDFSDCKFTNAILGGADFSHSKLVGANLQGSSLDDTNLYDSDLSNANVSECSDIMVNNTIIRNTRFSPNAKDLWSVLRRTYTGHRLILNLLFFIIFISPYVVKTLYWYGINAMQAVNDSVFTKYKTQETPEVLENYARCLSSSCDEYTVWQLILGLDKEIYFWVLTVLLLTYNICKIGLTWYITPLREEEERSGHSPLLHPTSDITTDADCNEVKKIHWHSIRQSYGWLIWPHRFVTSLFWIAIISFVVHGYSLLILPVFIPS